MSFTGDNQDTVTGRTGRLISLPGQAFRQITYNPDGALRESHMRQSHVSESTCQSHVDTALIYIHNQKEAPETQADLLGEFLLPNGHGGFGELLEVI